MTLTPLFAFIVYTYFGVVVGSYARIIWIRFKSSELQHLTPVQVYVGGFLLCFFWPILFLADMWFNRGNEENN